VVEASGRRHLPSGSLIRQQLIEQLTREILNYDAEFRREDAAGATASHARH
jgi:hypothetical protein